MMAPSVGPKLRESAAAILLDTNGRLLLQLRDNVPHIQNPGKIGLFGGAREGNEGFLDCIVREIHEEIGYYLPPDRFERIFRWFGADDTGSRSVHTELFLARDVPVEKLTVTEGSLKIVTVDELEQLRDALTPGAKYALEFFLDRKQLSRLYQLALVFGDFRRLVEAKAESLQGAWHRKSL